MAGHLLVGDMSPLVGSTHSACSQNHHLLAGRKKLSMFSEQELSLEASKLPMMRSLSTYHRFLLSTGAYTEEISRSLRD